MSDTTSTTPALPVAEVAPPINYDLTCLNCRYNLRGLTDQSTCPECGAAVADTLTHFKARWSVEQIITWRRGCQWLGSSGATTAAIPVLLLVVSVGSMNSNHAEMIFFFVLLGCVVLEYAMWAVGCWIISGRHPGETLVARGMLWAIRWLGIAVLAVVCFLLLCGLMSMVYQDGIEVLMGFGICVGLAIRFVTVLLLSKLMSRTLGAAGNIWKRRNLLVSSVAVMALCAAQFFATALLILGDGSMNDSLLGVSMALGIPSILALPCVAAWASVASFRAAVAFRLPTSG